mgnify:CR=1 FL=1
MSLRLPHTDLHPHIWEINPSECPPATKPAELLTFLLRYAILAPSVHNTQPWQCSITGASLTLRQDPNVQLRDSDPTARETYISFGAFVANLEIAAKAFGHSLKISWLPSGYRDLSHIAEIELHPGKKETSPDTEALDALRHRRNYRGKFTSENVPQAVISELQALQTPRSETSLTLVTDRPLQKKIAALIQLAATFGFSNQKFRRELADFIVPNNTKRLDGIPGYASNIQSTFSSQMMPHVIRGANIGPWQGRTLRDAVLSAPVLACIGGTDDAYHGWLSSGYYLQQVLTTATKHGLAHSIWAALIELPGASPKLQRMVGTPHRPHIFFGLGHASQLPRHSARKPVSAILKKH